MRLLKLCLICMLSSICCLAFTQTNIISDSLLKDLRAEQHIQKIFVDDEKCDFSMAPHSPLAQQVSKVWDSEKEPTFVSENLYLLKKETLRQNSSNPQNCNISIDNAGKIIRCISKMKGMEYWSNGDQKWETLYHKAYLIDSVKDKNPIPDNTEGSADGYRAYCLLDDNSFGVGIYRLDYKQTDNEVFLSISNEEPLRYGPVKAAKSNNVKINFVVTEYDDENYLVYVVVEAKYIDVPLLQGRIKKSLNNRVGAIYKWFTNQF